MEAGHVPEGRLLMTRRLTRRVEVIGVGTPPPLALRPLVDEVVWVLAPGREPSDGSIDDCRPGRPAGSRARHTPREGAHWWQRAVVIMPVLLEWPRSGRRLSDQPSSAARMFAIFRASPRAIMRTASGTSKRARPTASAAIVTV